MVGSLPSVDMASMLDLVDVAEADILGADTYSNLSVNLLSRTQYTSKTGFKLDHGE